MKIIAQLPADRMRLGTITARDDAGNIALGPFPCLAVSDGAFAASQGNPERDPLRRGGDMPLGGYLCQVVLADPPVDEGTLHSYGPHGYIRLIPKSGSALVSDTVNGRTGLLIHGGALNPAYTYWGGLRPTHGCLRLHDDAVLDLITMMARSIGPVYCDAQEFPIESVVSS